MPRKAVDFSSGDHRPPEQAEVGTSYTHVDGMGRTYVWHFSKVGRPDFASALSRYLFPHLRHDMAGKASPTVAQFDTAWRTLARILNERGADFASGLLAIELSDIATLDDPKRYGQTRCIIHSIRIMSEHASEVVSDAIKARLNYISSHGNSYRNPREPISSGAADAAKLAADRVVAEARDRIRKGRLEKARVEALAEKTRSEMRYLALASGERSKNNDAHVKEYAESVVIGVDDTVAFLIAIGLRAQLPFECLKGLRRDCLQNEARGFVDVVYLKGRGGLRPVWKRERVRDGGLSTPGGLLRLALELSEPAAERLRAEGHPDAECLWVGWVSSGRPAWRAFDIRATTFKRALPRLGVIWSDAEDAAGFAPSRMRKTVKAQMYRRAKGHLRRFATDHSVGVAAQHYANVEALAEEHKDTVRLAQEDLLGMALAPLVLSAEDEARLHGQGITESEHPERERLDPGILGGEHDTWLGICADFWSSPFDRSSSGGCAASSNACLRCSNAVFTARRLPALLTYRDWLVSRRGVMGHDEWMNAHHMDVRIIEDLIVPRLSADGLDQKSELRDTVSLFIPLHERRS